MGCQKLNTDASVKQVFKSCTIGGLIHPSNWVKGFYEKIGECNISSAEIWALSEGLCMAWEMRIPNLEVETDSDRH